MTSPAALLIIGPFALGFDGSTGGLDVLYIIAGPTVLALRRIAKYRDSPARNQPVTTSLPSTLGDESCLVVG